MSTLHIANATAQFHLFMYRVPGGGLVTQEIPPGGQIRISAKGGNLSTEDIAAIINQHAPYGLIPVEEVGKRVDKFYGYCYSIDRPVSFARLAEQIMTNRQVMIDRGTAERSNAGVAASTQLRQEIIEQGRTDRLQQLSFEVKEQDPARVIGDRQANTDGLEAALAEMPSVDQRIDVVGPDAPPPNPAHVQRVAARRRRGATVN